MSWNDSSFREDRKDFDRTAFWTGGRIILFIVVGTLVAAILSAVIWAVTVGTSGVKGVGDGIIQKNSSQNWLDAQARFEENYADYESTIFKIDQAAKALQADPNNAILATNYSGTVNYCASLVADYNADARNYLREDFRSADLPDELDVDTCEPVQLPKP